MGFRVSCKDKKTDARAGILETRSGPVETPFFMPVATKATLKHIASDDLERMGAKAVISNAFILSLRPGPDIIKKAGGVGRFMDFKGAVFTDSGGFQMYSKKIYLESREEGVIFRNPYSGEKIFMTPDENMRIQLDIGSDVAMCLDTMPLYGDSKEAIEEAVKKTILWAKRCKLAHDKMQDGVHEGKRQMLFGITQGGIYDDLRRKSAAEISEMDFDGFALGGLALGEPEKDECRMIEIVKGIVPEGKPIYLMGAGEPIELLEAISRGADIFDSRFPTKNARHGKLFTWKGYINVTNARFKDDFTPIDNECDCFVCRRYTRAYIGHLLRHLEGTGYRLASYHNIYFLQRLMEKARKKIIEGKFPAFLKEMNKAYQSH